MAPKRKRNYAAEYRRRQAKARREGFSGYYGKRVRGGAKAKPSAPAPTGARLRRLRGHASASDLRREISSGDFVSAFPMARNAAGQWTRMRIDVIDGDTGEEREYTLTGEQLRRAALVDLAGDLDAAGARFSPKYDLRTLGTDDEEQSFDADEEQSFDADEEEAA